MANEECSGILRKLILGPIRIKKENEVNDDEGGCAGEINYLFVLLDAIRWHQMELESKSEWKTPNDPSAIGRDACNSTQIFTMDHVTTLCDELCAHLLDWSTQLPRFGKTNLIHNLISFAFSRADDVLAVRVVRCDPLVMSLISD